MNRRDFIVYTPTAAAVAALAFPSMDANAQSWFGLDTVAGPAGTWKKLKTKTNFQLVYTFPAGLSLNFNLRNFALGSGWNGTEIIEATINIPVTTLLGSTSASTPAFDTDTAFPDGSKITINIQGDLLGCGGKGGNASSNAAARTNGSAGGPALLVRYPTTINNTGRIGSGGGGGGAGQGLGYYINGTCDKYGCGAPTYYYFGGGGGGEGAGANRLGVGGGDSTLSTRYAYRYASNGGYANSSTPGAPGVSSYGSNGPNDYCSAGFGGGGGYLGAAGSNGGVGSYAGECCFYPTPFTWYPPTNGGAPGICIQGNSLITWVATGTRLGAIQP
jgi:hypothetical protein